MKPKQRQAAILEYLQRHGKTAVDALAEHFSTTGTTIRKDLTLLEEEGEVIRTYGGVVLSRDDGDQPIDRKTHINTEKKRQIASAAVALIADGDSLIFDAGSTVLQMVPHLAQFNNITVMTNSLTIVNALVELDNDQTILMPGGTYRKKSASFHGSLAESAFQLRQAVYRRGRRRSQRRRHHLQRSAQRQQGDVRSRQPHYFIGRLLEIRPQEPERGVRAQRRRYADHRPRHQPRLPRRPAGERHQYYSGRRPR